jgi:5,10-methylenetetrahydromethanopterin reductase
MVGYSLGPLLSASELIRCTQLADLQESVDSIWIPESWGRESFSSLGAMACVTNRISLGTSIISLFARTPATVAMGALTLDSLSGGRIIIGIGASTQAIVENLHGADFKSPVDRMKEYVACVRALTSGERVNFEGHFYTVRNFRLLEKPTRPNLPIYMAAINERMVSTAIEVADGILLYLRPVHELSKTVLKIRNATGGKKFEIALSVICAVSDRFPTEARNRAKKTLAFYVAVGKYYSDFLSQSGFADEVKQITKAYASGGIEPASRCISDRMLDALTIAGSSEQCRSLLKQIQATGVTKTILQFNPVESAESSFKEMLSTF